MMVASPAPLLAMLTTAAALGTSAVNGGVPTFAHLDTNGDGQLSVEEAEARHGLRELMADYDRDNDGGLDPGEYQQLLEDALQEVRRISTGNGSTQ